LGIDKLLIIIGDDGFVTSNIYNPFVVAIYKIEFYPAATEAI